MTELPSFLDGLPRARAAAALAAQRYARRRREADGAPAVLHPLEVAALLRLVGGDDVLVAAAVLHDLLEDTDTTEAELRERFGGEVARIVAGVTEDEAIADWTERKAALRRQVAAAGPEAVLVYAADKLAKARELRLRVAARTSLVDDAERRRLEHYRHSLTLLDAQLPGHPLVEALRFELEALERMPPARAPG